MRQTGFLSLALSVALLPLGCSTPTSSVPTSRSKTSDAKEKIGEAVDATADAAKAKKDEFVSNFQKGLDVLDAKLKALELRASEASGDAKKELDEKVKVAKAKRDVAAKKLSELKDASHDRWEKVKEGAGNAIDDLKKAFE
ncbi:MAG: hypothetical protein C0467_20775 [Planctomycetaceae bacterium]|nr:hypothetical protein [Planctomycetaceae bacterium]